MPCVIVMGCYRTGTSAVAGILHHLGVAMGEDFQEPNPQNPKGYFEDPEFLKINLEIYKAKQIDDQFDRDKAICEGKKKFNNLCEIREHKNLFFWGFKDPKFCLTAKHVELPVQHKIIWIHRDIDETALSLIKALSLHGADANMDKWRRFVKHYRDETVNFMAGCNAFSTLDIDFQGLLTSPRTVINQIAMFLEIPTNQDAFDFMEQ